MHDNPYRSIEKGEPGTIGWRVHYHEMVASTQYVAEQLACEGAAHGTVVIAETQSAGHGRLGREWFSPPGVNLYVTVILRPVIALSTVPVLGLVAGVAMAEAIETVAPGIAGVKWPNDLWLSGRKAGGALAQLLNPVDERQPCVLLGIGLNLNLTSDQLPADLNAIATSVLIETGKPCDRVAVAAALFARLDSRVREMQDAGFAPIAPVWEHYSVLTGRRITVFDGRVRQSGTVKGIAPDGALLLEQGEGAVRIMTGDVTVEKPDT